MTERRPARPVPRRRAGRSCDAPDDPATEAIPTAATTAVITAPPNAPRARRRPVAASRARSTALTDAVDEADLVAQHSPLMSPLVWDLAHIGSQEELWLVRDVGGRDAAAAGDRRPLRRVPALPGQPGRAAAAHPGRGARLRGRGARQGARRARPQPAGRAPARGPTGFAFGMIVQHEQQHDETMLATHQLRAGAPVLHAPPRRRRVARCRPARCSCRAAGSRWAPRPSRGRWTTSAPRTSSTLPAFWIATAPVTNGEYAEFVDGGRLRTTPAGGPTPAGSTGSTPGSSRRSSGHADGGGTWCRRRFGVVEPVPADEPVVHVCAHEADAYAAWAGKRLPTEAEWEKAARFDPATGRSRRYPWGDEDPTPEHANLGQRHLQPAPVGAYPPGASPLGVHQLIGDVWEWTSLGIAPLPRLRGVPVPGVLAGVLRRRLPGAARRLVRHRPGRGPGARSATGTTRSAGRSSPASGWPGTPPAERSGCAAIWPTWAADDAGGAGPRPPHSLLRQSYAPADMRGGGTVNADGFGVGLVPGPGADAVRYRSAAPIWTDAAFADLAGVTAYGGGARRGALGHRRHAGHGRGRGARSPRAAGCSATTAWSAAGRIRWAGSRRRCR